MAREYVTNLLVGFCIAEGAKLLVLSAFDHQLTVFDSFSIG